MSPGDSMRLAVIIVAAGSGSRFGGAKQFTELSGRPLMMWPVDLFEGIEAVDTVIIAAPPDRVGQVAALTASAKKVLSVAPGGSSRTESVANCLRLLPEEVTRVLIHDAARPLATPQLVQRVIERLDSPPGGAVHADGVVPAVAVTDTIKIVEGDRISATPERSSLRAVQTPQGFDKQALLQAYRVAESTGAVATDDAALLEATGFTVVVVDGDTENIKVTQPQDLERAEAILRARRGRNEA